MTVIRWNPLREIDDLLAQAGQLPITARALTPAQDKPPHFSPAAEVWETDQAYFIDLELPGVAAKDLNVTVHEGVISIVGERKATSAAESAAEIVAEAGAEATDQSAEEQTAEQTEERRVHRSERRYGKFERRFRLPKDAEFEAIDASAREGVLTVSIGRRKEEARRAIEVRVA